MGLKLRRWRYESACNLDHALALGMVAPVTVTDLVAEHDALKAKTKAFSEFMQTSSFLSKSKHEQNLHFAVWVAMQQTLLAINRLLEATQ